MRPTAWSWLIAALWLLAPALSPAQASASRRQIAQLEDAWVRAVIARDSVAFDRLLAPGFVYTEDDRVYSKEQLIREVVHGSDRVTSGRNEDLSVRLYGNTAIATGWLVLEGRGSSGAFTRRYRYTDTWVRLNGRWRVVAAQDYLKP
jgi:ketosteroid isomerase-like protein